MLQVCIGCEISKPTTEFVKDSTKPDGMSFKCKECRNRQYRLRYAVKEALNRMIDSVVELCGQ